jgi:hypothetical protein
MFNFITRQVPGLFQKNSAHEPLGALASRRRVPVFGLRLADGTPALP